MKPTIDIVIPSYNAEWLLEKNLPVVIKTSPEVDKIIVVDDGGTDNAPKYMKKWAPQVICIRHEENIGFSKSVNEGVSHSKADFLVFINNDVYPQSGYIQSALKYFQDPKVFAVNFNEENSSWPQVSWHSGKFQFVRGEDKKHPHFSAWPSGGSCILRRSIWDKLGGFNEIYSPAYWEDIDIGWRAWRSGYKIIWAPEPKVVHHHESTFGLKNKQYKSILSVIDNISAKISENIYRPFIEEQKYISQKIQQLYRKVENQLSDVSLWLDIFVFIKKYRFENVKNEIFGFIYENYLKELYEDKQKGQYFTDPAVVNFMLQ
ncbi:MAG: glycosyltransferase family 2 protein, partial [Patescibacteria group bacterium]